MPSDDLVVCPRCLGSLRQEPEGLFCDACGLCYPMMDGIPLLVVDEAVRVS